MSPPTAPPPVAPRTRVPAGQPQQLPARVSRFRGAVFTGRVPALDGLRGVAMLMVFVAHAVAGALWVEAGGAPLAPVDQAVKAVASHGWLGVDIFFVLSGFLITGILLDTVGRPHWWRNFFMRRALRIFPVHYGALFIAFVLLPLLTHWPETQFATLRANQAWYWTYTVNLLHALRGGESTPLFTSHFWSLSIEEHFYLVWPLVVAACRPRTLLRVIAITLTAGFVLRLGLVWYAPDQAVVAYLLTPMRLDSLLAGGAIATLARQPGGLALLAPRVRRALSLGVLGLVLIAVGRGGISYHDPVVALIGFPLIALTFGAIMVAVLTVRETHWLRRTLDNPSLGKWGIYSYAMYVFHYPLIGALLWKVPGLVDPIPAFGGSRLPGIAVLLVVTLVVSYGVAWLSYHLYEQRFLNLKRFFATA